MEEEEETRTETDYAAKLGAKRGGGICGNQERRLSRRRLLANATLSTCDVMKRNHNIRATTTSNITMFVGGNSTMKSWMYFLFYLFFKT